MRITYNDVEYGLHQAVREPPDFLKDFPLFKPLENIGTFWLPGLEMFNIPGSFAYNPGIIKLILAGRLSHDTKEDVHVSPIIHGRLAGGSPCTLFDCFGYSDSYFNPERFYVTHVTSKVAILGKHSESLEDLKVVFANLQFSHVQEWLPLPYNISHDKTFTQTIKFI